MPMTQEDITKYKALYLQAARDNLNKLQENSLLLLNGKTDEEIFENMHREAHSLKSESLLMGYNNMGQLSATIEEIFEERKENNTSISRDTLNMMDLSIKKMLGSLGEIEKTNTEMDLSEEIKQLRERN